ncbi:MULTISPECIES: hypothetical protein [unclassified Clostridium]|uniref:hypothetical protein n=1 Tax=unclassified Clostridium TaxID=2614128 RepID=UPI002079AF83|nr:MULTISPECIES: hypothetical protein [unclassified Clostridium]
MTDETKSGTYKSNEEDISKINYEKSTKIEAKTQIVENKESIEDVIEIINNNEKKFHIDDEQSYYKSQGKKINKDNKKLIITLGSIIVAIALIIGLTSLSLMSNPKIKVVKALKETNNEIKSRKTFFEKVTEKDDFLVSYKHGISEQAQMNIVHNTMIDTVYLNNAVINLNAQIDEDNKKVMMSLNGSNQGYDLGNINLYTDNNIMMVNLPNVHDAWFTFYCKNIEKQYNRSFLGKYGQLPNDEITLQLFDDEVERIGTYKEINKILVDGYLDSYKDQLNELIDNMEVKKLDDSKEFAINGKNENCTGYSIDINKEDVDKFLESIYSYINYNNQARIALNSYLNKINFVEGSDDSSIKVFNDSREFINYYKNKISVNNISMKVYIDKKGRTVGIDVDTNVNKEDKNFNINYSSNYKGIDNIGNDIDTFITVDDGLSKNNIEMNIKKIDEGKSTNNVLSMKVISDGKVININGNAKYDILTKTLEGIFSAQSDDKSVNFKYNGTYDFDETTQGLQFNFDQIMFESNEDNTPKNLTFSLSYGMEPYNELIKEPFGEKIELFDMSEYKFIDILEEMESNSGILKDALSLY